MAGIGYRAQLPGSVVLRSVRRQPGFGMALAKGVQVLGQDAIKITYADQAAGREIAESNQRIAEIEQKRARGAAVADGLGRLAEVQLQTEQEVQALRDRSEPGAPGYAAAAEEIRRKNWDGFAATLPRDPEVEEYFTPVGARWLSAGIGQEREWERDRRVTHIGGQLETWVETQAAGLFSNPDPDAYLRMIRETDDAIALQGLDGTTGAELGKRARAKYTAALFDGMAERKAFDALDAVLQSGQFDAHIGGAEGKARWLARVEAGRDVQAREAEAAANAVKRAAGQEMDRIEALIETGETVPQAQIEAAIAGWKAAGGAPDKAIRFADAGNRAVASRAARGMETPDVESGLAALQEKRGSGRATEAEVRMADALEAELKARDVKAGGGIAELAKAGPGGQAQAAAQLARMNPERRWAAAREAGDERLAVYASLTPAGQAFAAEGRSLRQERKEDFLPPKDSRGRNGGDEAARAMFRQMLGQHLTDELGETYGEHLEAALDLMAGTTRRWDEQQFRRAVQVVFGQTKRPDGTWQGGIGVVRNKRVELPPKWTAEEFDRAYSRFGFDGAVYADGTAAQPADVRNHFRPRYIGEDEQGRSQYYLIGRDGHPLGRKGQGNFILRVGAKP